MNRFPFVMFLKGQDKAQLLILLVVALVVCSGTARKTDAGSKLLVPKKCSKSDMSLCGCQAVPNGALPGLRQLYQQDIHSEAYCGEKYCHQTCRKSVCSFAMGQMGELCTTTVIDEAWVIYVREAKCSFDSGMRTYKCVKGKSIAYPDEQTYRAITEGYCIPTCDMNVKLFRCTFEPRFRDESSIHPGDLETPPFTTVTGVISNQTEAASPDPQQSEEPEGSSPGFPESSPVESPAVKSADSDEVPESPGAEKEGEVDGGPDSSPKKSEGEEDEPDSDPSADPQKKKCPKKDKPLDKLVDCTKGEDDEDGIESDDESGDEQEEPDEDDSDLDPDHQTPHGKKEGEPSDETEGEPKESESGKKDKRGKGPVEAPKDGDGTSHEDESAPGSALASLGAKDHDESPPGSAPASTGTKDEETAPGSAPASLGAKDDDESAPGSAPASIGAKDDDESSSGSAPASLGAKDDDESAPGSAPASIGAKDDDESALGSAPASSGEEDDDEDPLGSAPALAFAEDEDESAPGSAPSSSGKDDDEDQEEGSPGHDGTAEPSISAPDDLKPQSSPVQTHTLSPEGSSSYTLYYSPFRECTQVCAQAGDSYKERSITCRDYAGVPVPLDFCVLPSQLSERFYLKCQNDECGPDYYVVLSDWTTCPSRCREIDDETGRVIPKYSTRDFVCRRVSDDSLANQSECKPLIEELEVLLEVECNTVPCERYFYSISDWSFCDCETWKQERTVTCTRQATGEVVDAALCEAYNLTLPVADRKCYPQECFENGQSRKLLQDGLDYCNFTECSTKGRCRNQECMCRRGFEGPDCQIDARSDSQCPVPSLLDVEGDCCTSGVFDHSGTCCDGVNGETDIDIDGNCCVGRPLDACGRCDDDRQHFLDSASQCCEVLDASGSCCWSGLVDECGVCDGFGRSCNTTIIFDVQVDTNRHLRDCTRQLRSVVEIALDITDTPLQTHHTGRDRITFCRTNITETSGFIEFRVESVLRNKKLRRDCRIESMTSGKLPMCGNGVCETGENANCPSDCDFSIQLCEASRGLFNQPVMCSGHGLCSFVNGSQCSCFTGYTGKNCERCSSGFFHVGDDSRCITGQAFANKDFAAAEPDVSPTSGNETAVFVAATLDRDAPNVANNSNDDDQSAYLLAAAAVIIALFITVVAILVAIRRAKKKHKGLDRHESVALNANSEDSSHGDRAEPSSSRQ